MNNNNDDKMEALLRRYRLAGAPKGLEVRIFAAGQAPGEAAEVKQGRGIWAMVRRGLVSWLVAAMLMIIVGLSWASENMERQIEKALVVREEAWTAEAEEIAQMLDGNGAGRRYINMLLAMDRGVNRGVYLLKQLEL